MSVTSAMFLFNLFAITKCGYCLNHSNWLDDLTNSVTGENSYIVIIFKWYHE